LLSGTINVDVVTLSGSAKEVG